MAWWGIGGQLGSITFMSEAGRALDFVLMVESESLDPESVCSGLDFGNLMSKHSQE